MAYPGKSNWGLFTNHQQARLQTQIQNQTAALLNERNNLTNTFTSNQNWQTSSFKPQVQQNSRIISKVQQIINLCSNQNTLSSGEMATVINAQKQILNLLLKKNQNLSEKQNLQGTYQSNNNQKFLYSVPQNNAEDPQNSQFRSNIRQKIQSNPKITVSDDLIGMIQQIENKALTQIQKLREQKISLMKQLKAQIQQNNNLQRQLISFGQNRQQSKNQTPFKQYRQSGIHNFDRQAEYAENIQQFKSYIAHLQSELQRKDSIIRQIGNASNSNNSGHIMQLLQQGEHIRQNTIHLIKLKQQNYGLDGSLQNGSNHELINRIKELEQLLQKEEEQKGNFFNDLLAFKQKYQSLEDENKELKRQNRTTTGTLGASYNQTKIFSNSPKNEFRGGNSGFDEYQKVLSRMRKARG